MQTSEPLVPVSEIEEAIERADGILVEAMKKATVIVTLHDLNEVAAAAALLLARLKKLEAQLAEASTVVDPVDRVDELHAPTAEALMREFAEEQPGVDPADSVAEPAEPVLSPQAVEERDWLRSKGLDASAALLLVRWMANQPRGTATASEAAAKWDLTADQALAMVRRYGPIIGQLRELRGTKYDAKLAEFKNRLGVAS